MNVATKLFSFASRRVASLGYGFKSEPKLEISDGRYCVRLAETPSEVETALRLRFDVFNIELANRESEPGSSGLEFDNYDFKCRHLIVVEKATGKTVGTYRLNTIESAVSSRGFYSYSEFSIEDLPSDILENGIEIGRACISAEHRNTKVLLLLWKGLAKYLTLSGKRYFFGCCSVFSQDESVGKSVYQNLARNGNLHPELWVTPRNNTVSLLDCDDTDESIALPNLFNMYLRIGSKVCSPPMIDRDFGTIDYFVVFDLKDVTPKYKKLLFD